MSFAGYVWKNIHVLVAATAQINHQQESNEHRNRDIELY